MTSTADGAYIFRPVNPGVSVTTLLLIENSAEMISLWPGLRERYLQNVLGNIRAANPVVPIRVLVIPSSPVLHEPSEAANPFSPGPRQPHDPLAVRFDTRSDNRISPEHIVKAVEIMLPQSTSPFDALHIILVAATSPFEDVDPSGLRQRKPEVSPWILVGRKLAQHNIRCHLVINTAHSVQGFIDMFSEHVKLQNLEEVPPWFETEPNGYQFHFAASRPGDFRPIPPRRATISEGTLPRTRSHSSELNSLASPNDSAAPSEAPGPTNAPTLVNTIQQQWGLTRKKIYASLPPREPFFRDERVVEQAPPLFPVSPVASPASPTRDPRLAQGKVQRHKNRPASIDLHTNSRRTVPYHRRTPHKTPLSSPTDSTFSLPVYTVGTPLSSPPQSIPSYTPPPSYLPVDIVYGLQTAGVPNGYPSLVSPEPVHDDPLSNNPYFDNVGVPPLLGPVPDMTLTPERMIWQLPPCEQGLYPSLVAPSYPTAPFQAQGPPCHTPPEHHPPSPKHPHSLMQVSQLPPRLLAAASRGGNVPFIFSEEKEKETKALLKAAGLQDVPLPQIVAASLSARGMTHLPPELAHLPYENAMFSAAPTLPTSWTTGSTLSPGPMVPSPSNLRPLPQVDPMYSNHVSGLPQMQDMSPYFTDLRFGQDVPPSSSSLMGWNG